MLRTLSEWWLLASIALTQGLARAGDTVFIAAGDDPAAPAFVDEVSQFLRRRAGGSPERVATVSAGSFRSGYALTRRDDSELAFDTAVRGRTRSAAPAAPPGPAASPPGAFELLSERQPSLILVAVGPAALRVAIEAEAGETVLAVLLSREQLDEVAGSWSQGDRRHRLLAIVTDQPVERQLALARLALPEARRVGVVYTPESEAPFQRLQDAAAEARQGVTAERINEATELKDALDRVIGRCDLLLVLSDPVSTAPGVGQALLQAANRAGRPVVAATESFVRSGALAGVFTSRAQFARQTFEGIQRARMTDAALGIEEPRYFSVRVNSVVARGLGLELPAEASLEASLGASLEAESAGRR